MDEFDWKLYEIVRQIPPGLVSTYGHLAVLAGYPGRARMAGKAMARAPESLGIPCHRVVNGQGRTAPGWIEQRELLEQEGITFRKNGLVDLKKHLWL